MSATSANFDRKYKKLEIFIHGPRKNGILLSIPVHHTIKTSSYVKYFTVNVSSDLLIALCRTEYDRKYEI
jgi:hypothetical protein